MTWLMAISSLCLPVLVLIIGYDMGMVSVVYGADEYRRDDFPADFVFGAATSAYQVEGAALEDGRTPSIWDTFAHDGYLNGDTGDIACDGYNKYKEDIQLMADTGLEAYRFSISWSRLIPNGRGPVNPKGLHYYNSFINKLISHGIQPHVTIFHNDLPQVLEDEYGGWVSEKSVEDYIAYADVCFREFGDRVLHWSTFNEANVFALGGYDVGSLPPAHCSAPFGIHNCTRGNSSSEPYIVAHNLLVAHASTVRLYWRKYKDKQHGFIGINLLAYWFAPYTNSLDDVIAAQRANDFYLGWFLDPLVFGDYPDTVKKNAGSRIPALTEFESKLIKGSFDFLGLNHYFTLHVKDNPSSLQLDVRDVNADMAVKFIFTGGNSSPYQFPVTPLDLQRLLDHFKHVYGNPPVYIHENGQVDPRDGLLNDKPRVKYLHGYIGSLLDAVRNGSNTRGYFVWSFLDVFELLDGYKSAFGLYYVDMDDKELRRYPKLSAQWYSSFLKGTNISKDEGLHLGMEEKWSDAS